jgi:hypothetical protein
MSPAAGYFGRRDWTGTLTALYCQDCYDRAASSFAQTIEFLEIPVKDGIAHLKTRQWRSISRRCRHRGDWCVCGRTYLASPTPGKQM